jgi:hypothetical protein
MTHKRDQQWDIKCVCQVDILEVKNIFSHISEDLWNNDIARQQIFEVHKSTQTIIINEYSIDWCGTEYNPFLKFPEFFKPIRHIAEKLEQIYNGKKARCLLVKLKSNSTILPHVDSGYYLENCHRCHIPIITNPEVFFSVGEATIHMREGSVYEINNSHMHSVYNKSEHDRIHLIIDILPNALLN